MLEVRKTVSSVLTIQNKLKEASETLNSLVQSAEQRLKWAAGANPALNEVKYHLFVFIKKLSSTIYINPSIFNLLLQVLSAFEGCIEAHKEKVSNEQSFALQVVGFCSTVLHHEALRTSTKEAITSDANFFLVCVLLYV